MKNSILLSMLVLFLAVFSGCSKNESNGIQDTGTLKISITDAPFPIDMVEHAGVVITKVELRSADTTSEDPYLTVFNDTMELNLLDLRNGTIEDLPDVELPVGEYDLVRLIIDHAFITVNGITYNLKVPSGEHTGIKVFIHPAIQIAGGLSSELLLDFNLDRSFVMKGNMDTPAGIKGFGFKPVIRAVNISTAGSVQGSVSDPSAVSLENAEVWIAADTTIATAYTDTSGFYLLPGIPAGTYALYATMENYDTVMVSDVDVVAGNRTVVDFQLTPKEE